MKKRFRFLCLALTAVLLLTSFSLLASCGEEETHVKHSGERGADGDWSDVNFGGSELVVSVSVNQDTQTTFPSASIYTMGPDRSKGNVTDSVQKKVLKRNDEVEKELGIKVTYQTTDLPYTEVGKEIEKIVLGSAEDAPDVFNNDLLGLSGAMYSGYLWNVKNPGKDLEGDTIQSYFDFSYDGWYREYMEGATLDSQKMYILAGDYYIDLIRFAWVLFVNREKFDQAYTSLPGYGPYEDICDMAASNVWTWDDMIALCRAGLIDSLNVGEIGKAEETDTRLPLYLNPLACRIFLYGSNFSIVKWTGGAVGKGTPSIVSDTEIGPLIELNEKYRELLSAKGVFYKRSGVENSTLQFIKGNVIMSMCELGEMESESMRAAGIKRGVLPYPTMSVNEDYNIIVHDQAEVGCILRTTDRFAIASAYLQMINEKSADVLRDYYENSLKFKYSEGDTATRDMIDLVHDSIRSPFNSMIVMTLGQTPIHDYFHMSAEAQQSDMRGLFVSQRPVMQDMLEQKLTKFKELD